MNKSDAILHSRATKRPAFWARRPIGRLLTNFGVPLALLFTVALFSLLRPAAFPTWRNLDAILTLAAPLAVTALGITVVLAQGDLDLSFGSVIGLAGAVTFVALAEDRWALAWPVALLGGLLVGALAGAINGALIAYVGLAPIITTLGMSTALVGVEFLFTDQQTVYGNVPEAFTQIGRGVWLGLNVQVWLAGLVVLLMYGLMEQTELGRYFYALGGNREAAHLSGISVKAVRMTGFLISGLAGALTGVLIVAQSASSSPTAGAPYLLPALTAAFLGTSMFRQGQFNVLGTTVGVLFLGVIQTGLIMLHLSTAIINIVQGAVLVTAILVSRFGARP